ncbi:hypothetical protein BJ508DRAFT_321630 [Ascobolus immersus RN42]|uniref:lytic cellulose monooxygenase (C4-dehydrogenating) n=1 Tax=Ascobolus immersus RN42 TaxID=1160509 RepID=A0A3N4IQK2_ASCIM|nr:hypothetical protein BJ508DRAFT_321630 [Ascobolus immersus RN42]
MKFNLTVLAVAAACFQGVSAHYRFTRFIANGQVTGEYEYVRRNTNMNSPLSSTDAALGCNAGAQSGGNTKTITVAAGSTVGFQMDQAIFHHGPTLAYMAKAPGNLASFDGKSGWFKIWQEGPIINGGSVTWPADNKSSFQFRIPSSIQAGDYLVRIEHIALHGMPSQHYVSCAQVKVTGGGNASPATVNFPGAYSPNDPGININIYYPVPTNYKMPGPAVFQG